MESLSASAIDSDDVTGEHPDAIAYKRTADAFRMGDLEVIESLIASDVVWHVPGEHPMAGTIEGRVALLEWLARLRGIGFWLVEHDVFASDEHVCAVSTMGARRGDVDAQTRVISVFQYREGQQIERWVYPDDTASWNAIFTT